LTHYFLESSAFAKLFVLEDGSDALILLLESVDDSQKQASALASLEVRSAIRRREQMGDIRPSDATRALASLEAECARISEQPLTPAVVRTAKLVLDFHRLRTLDALHLATCIVIRDTRGIADICFVSADDALLRAAEAEHFPILNPLKL
jgi:predicted nucleic acid-binding protein